jgi:hypothetical protein
MRLPPSHRLSAFSYPLPVFDSHALSITAWMRVIFVSASVFILVEVEKWILRSRGRVRGASIRAPAQLD